MSILRRTSSASYASKFCFLKTFVTGTESDVKWKTLLQREKNQFQIMQILKANRREKLLRRWEENQVLLT